MTRRTVGWPPSGLMASQISEPRVLKEALPRGVNGEGATLGAASVVTEQRQAGTTAVV